MGLAGGVAGRLADQVIGFKVGASIWGGPAGYSFDSSSYAYDWTLVRAVRIAVVGRTSPITDPSVNYHNSFDQGPYHVQAISVVINPRNLSMND